MELETVLKERKILEAKIAEALQDFHVKTGLRIISVGVGFIIGYGDNPDSRPKDIYSVNVEIRL